MRCRVGAASVAVVAAALTVGAPARAQAPTEPAPAAPAAPADAVSSEPSPSAAPDAVPDPPPQPAPVPPPAAAPPPPPAPVAAPAPFSRRGFFVSAGLGTSIVNYSLDVRFQDSLSYAGSVTELVPATMLKLGAGVGDKTALHFTNRIAWLNHADPAAVDHHERIATMSALSGVGITHFLDAERRSVFLGADLGISQWLSLDDFARDLRDVGVGLCGEIGYAFFPGLSFAHSVCWASVTSKRRGADSGTELDAELGMPLTASFTLNYLK